MAQKKLRGSGGYTIARITDEEQKKGNLGGPELFLAGIGRLDEERFVKYYCNKCEKEYEGSPAINYENPNEELGEGVTLIEKGEYKCKTCSATIAQYRKFDAPAQKQAQVHRIEEAVPDPKVASNAATASDNFVPLQSLVGMSAYDSEAILIGKVEQIGLSREAGRARIALKVGTKQVSWDGISKIGDIVLLKAKDVMSSAGGKCHACGYENEAGSAFCAECGANL